MARLKAGEPPADLWMRAASKRVDVSDGRADALKKNSFQMTGDKADQESWVKMAQNRAHMRGAGFTDADFTKPIVTVAVPYSNALECNNTLLDLARVVVEEVEKAGGIGFYCMAPVISDGNTQGTKGMRYSLFSRDWIADCVEIMHEGYMADACISFGACDKTVPGAVMPLARCDTSGCFIYGGPLVPGFCDPPLRADAPSQYHRGLDAGSVVEASGSFSAGLIDLEELHRIECDAMPRSGTCSGMFTANTMASIAEALGMSLPGQSSHVAVTEDNVPTEAKRQDCANAVAATFAMLRAGVTARDIMTKEAFENAVTVQVRCPAPSASAVG